jgi:hypothetical protein
MPLLVEEPSGLDVATDEGGSATHLITTYFYSSVATHGYSASNRKIL